MYNNTILKPLNKENPVGMKNNDSNAYCRVPVQHSIASTTV